MTEGHVIESLSELIDGRLAEERRAAVEAHLSACSSCRAELEGIKAVSAALKGMPRRPLPAGFMQRLERRRLEGEAPEKDGVFLSFPARTAAFVLASFLVCFVIFEILRTKKRPAEVESLVAAQGEIAAPDMIFERSGQSAGLLAGRGSAVSAARGAARKSRAPTAPALFQGAAAGDKASALAAWGEAGLPGKPPAFDPAKSMLVIAPGAIIDARESSGRIVVRYRPGDAPAARRFAIIPRSPFPAAFEREPF